MHFLQFLYLLRVVFMLQKFVETNIIAVQSSPEVIKLFILISAEHEIYPAHKC